MSRQFKIAVVGATGAVGEVMLSVLSERKFPVGELVALASERSRNGAHSGSPMTRFCQLRCGMAR